MLMASQLAEPLWTDPGLKSGTECSCAKARNDRRTCWSPQILAWDRKGHHHHHHRHHHTNVSSRYYCKQTMSMWAVQVNASGSFQCEQTSKIEGVGNVAGWGWDGGTLAMAMVTQWKRQPQHKTAWGERHSCLRCRYDLCRHYFTSHA